VARRGSSAVEASMRIASLSPSATEILFASGAGGDVAGVTDECDYPPAAAALPALTPGAIDHERRPCARDRPAHPPGRCSSLHRLDERLLGQLRPGLIITQGCARCARCPMRRCRGRRGAWPPASRCSHSSRPRWATSWLRPRLPAPPPATSARPGASSRACGRASTPSARSRRLRPVRGWRAWSGPRRPWALGAGARAPGGRRVTRPDRRASPPCRLGRDPRGRP